MLSDEENEAIGFLEKLKNLNIVFCSYAFNNGKVFLSKEEKEQINKIINLIEKQSKEIEELKAISEYREKIIKGLGLKTLPETITGFRKLIENNDKKWQDKIKAKIEEFKKQIEKMEKDDDGVGFTLGKEWSDLKAKVEFGQSLLEKE